MRNFIYGSLITVAVTALGVTLVRALTPAASPQQPAPVDSWASYQTVTWTPAAFHCYDANGREPVKIVDRAACAHSGTTVVTWRGSDGEQLVCSSGEPPKTREEQIMQMQAFGRLSC